MEKKRITHPQRATDFSTGAYSDGVIVGDLLFVSGQTPMDFATSTYALGTIEEETRQVLNNIKAILEAGGASMDNVVKCTVHLADSDDFDRFNAEYATFFTGVRPARTTVESGLKNGIKVEIDVIAKLDTP
ncbi:2-iminobutanoate/2-iminopropanoate deaminase [Lewinella marina]|uniref:Reactive intermediate/imine deaminase n=1 Tax=Neolewinella marina TaxID=438751 RepID=A0A2G0CCH0_9BACT|nr:Rid family detoxifying hydrolase [Neolewinella marina]NJB87704.1 2-iminobutanoate/2-iminopropanoate deaminase [Neolewinella marina]PHK97617.1 reactive intermediate/imine deaminase [Neolewinella marina]